ncbi:Hypothetical protein ADU73_0882 [Pediococcus damnosus]|uniref:hypothetical protein n=1 Tax=Pediococcus damnosus TaxID=51663 RepID=UPI00078CCD86|nr:hypothetical protein [Pediococcus damnosus]AMV69288.1 Hypothetical protein ADU73_0882 [Pediococcus damnosus]
MKRMKKLYLMIGLPLVCLCLLLAGCAKTGTDSGTTIKSSVPRVSKVSARKQIRNNGGLWYFAKDLKYKSNSGIEAFTFTKNGKVTAYNVKKYYASYAAAKKAKGLSSFGKGNYKLTTNKQKQTVLTLKMKLSGIPATYSFKLKKGLAKKYKGLTFHGFNAARTVDSDTVNGILVQAKK